MQHAVPPSTSKRPVLIGLIGGVASGKSTVARHLASKGALWLDADKTAREVLEGADVRAELRERYSETVFDSHGKVNRPMLAAIVFGVDAAAQTERHWLEQLIHPRVRAQFDMAISEAEDRYPAIVIDAPLLLEAGWDKFCDHVLLIETPRALRQELATARGWTTAELDKREASQMSLDEKQKRATAVIFNAGTLDDLRRSVDDFWESYVTGA